ncbi:hypothetical protein ACFL0D_06655 [Thermoproteota archaeon]
MRRISNEIKRTVLQMWLDGASYRTISKKQDLGLGTISRTVEEHRKRSPDIDELRKLNLQLKTMELSLHDAIRGTKCIESLNHFGMNLDELETYRQLITKISESKTMEPFTFVEGAMKLKELENETEKNYIEVVTEFAEKHREINMMKQTMHVLKEQIKTLNSKHRNQEEQYHQVNTKYIATDKALKRIVAKKDRLKRLGVDKIDQVAAFVEDFETLGYTTKEITQLARLKKSLKNIGVTSTNLSQFIENKQQINHEIKELDTQRENIKARVERLQRQFSSLRRTDNNLKFLGNLMEKRITEFACGYCNVPIIMYIPGKLIIDDAMAYNKTFFLRCLYCGNVKPVTPIDIVANIGYYVLYTIS